VATTRGALVSAWRLSSTLDAADDAANGAAFGRPASSRGPSAYPQIRFVSLSKMARTCRFGRRMGRPSELALAREVLPRFLPPGLSFQRSRYRRQNRRPAPNGPNYLA
jgi:hypothetical protein